MSSPSYDAMLFADSMQDSEPFESCFVDRQIISVPDSNNGSYAQGQIVFDLNALSTSEAFMDIRGASIQIPFEMRIDVRTAANNFVTNNGAENAYAMTMKNCVYNLIDSLSFSINGTEVVSQVPLSNVYNTYRILTTWGPNDVESQGPSYGFSKDTADSFAFDNTMGEQNTRLIAGANSTVPGTLGGVNTGRLRRARQQAVSIDAAVAQMQTNLNRAMNLWMSTCTTAAKSIVYSMFLTVPLKGLHPVFEAMPLLRKSLLKLTLNTNAPSSYSATLDPATSVYTNPIVNTPRGTLPFNLTAGSAAAGTGFAYGDCVGIVASCKIGNATSNQCQVRLNRFLLSAEDEVKYLSDSVKTVVYNDYFQHTIPNVTTSINNVQIGSALSRVRRLLVFPYLTEAANRGVSPLASPWSTSPATCAPYFWASNVNCAVSGQNVFSQALNYRYEQWVSEIESSGINGGYTSGIRSGLVSKYDYDSLLGVIDINLSRKSAIADESPQIVSLTLKPEHNLPVNLVCFLEYSRQFSIDIGTGALMA